MDHPLIGTQPFAAARRAAYVPPVSVGGRAVADRLERHLAVLVPDRPGHPPGTAVDDAARIGADQTVRLLREITPRPTVPARRHMSLRAPLRSFKRWIGF